ncbi:Flp family type IVb pilin [Trichloromonas sp.]|uniref:Flp family type IVb pilin n=1 Tax=Trichloromonas sp. TaxID=3069249 RepID=UPI003D81652E
MKKMMEGLKRFMNDEEGATAVEYGIMVALVAVAIIGTVTTMAGGLKSLFGKVNTELTK